MRYHEAGVRSEIDMSRRRTLPSASHAMVAGAVLLAAAPAVGPAVEAADGGALADLPSFKTFQAVRYSRHDPTGGNAEGRHDRPIRPGETRTIADLPGAGAVVHIWITIASKAPNRLGNLELRMYWGGEAGPRAARASRCARRAT